VDAELSLPEPALQIAVGHNTACALLPSGHVSCDGFGGVPPGASPLGRISAGGDGVCGLTSTGSASCTGDVLDHFTPHDGPYADLVNTAEDACGMRGDGVVECWGWSFGDPAGIETCQFNHALLRVAELSCPGAPVPGELRMCTGSPCDMPAVTGSIDGVEWSHDYGNASVMRLVRSESDGEHLTWGVLMVAQAHP